MSLPRIFSLFRKRTEEEQRYFEVRASPTLDHGRHVFRTHRRARCFNVHGADADSRASAHPRHQAREQIV